MVEQTPRPATRSHTIREALDQPEGTIVTIMGWMAHKSSVGGIKFATIRDGSGYIQVACKKDRVSVKAFADFESATRESAIALSGSIREDKRAPGGKEIQIGDFWILSAAEK